MYFHILLFMRSNIYKMNFNKKGLYFCFNAVFWFDLYIDSRFISVSIFKKTSGYASTWYNSRFPVLSILLLAAKGTKLIGPTVASRLVSRPFRMNRLRGMDHYNFFFSDYYSVSRDTKVRVIPRQCQFEKMTKWDRFWQVRVPQAYLTELLDAIGAKLIGPHGGLWVGKDNSTEPVRHRS